ncbi:hypothetical protein OO185_02535 [Prosthecochloris sp. SCSIO W1102]|nr:hypothetical protein [Prosthecochloris sp. SCSIO W1102]UZJ39998.1 hypothetical protein OO185_02535 [Prosthecochloris sp. SCSIO W1102]
MAKVEEELGKIYNKIDSQMKWTIGLCTTLLFETAALIFAAFAIMQNNG